MEKETGEIVIFQAEDSVRLEVRVDRETVWLNRQQIAQLFGRDIKTIGKHINNALSEELKGLAVVANIATTASDGKTYHINFYNIEMITSVGYRVKSQRGILFRQWANKVLKEYLLKGYAINQRIDQIEKKVAEHDEKIEFFIKSSLPPVQGVFFDGQVFDAYVFVSDLIKRAAYRIVLIDNYIDETVLTLLDKRNVGVSAIIYTHKISPQFQLDIEKHNAQYPPVDVKIFRMSHDISDYRRRSLSNRSIPEGLGKEVARVYAYEGCKGGADDPES